MPLRQVSSQPQSLIHLYFIGWALVVIVVVWQTSTRTDPKVAAITSGLVLALSLVSTKYALGLAFMSGPLLYLGLLGIFHLGLVVPWSLNLYDISQASWFTPFGLSPALLLVNYSILAFELGIIVALAIRPLARRQISPLTVKNDIENSSIFIVGILAFFVGVMMFVTGLVGLDPLGYYLFTYSEIFRLMVESDPRLFGTGITLALIGLSMGISGAPKRQIKVVLTLTAAWVLTLMYFGFRGPGLIAGLIVYVVAVKKHVHFPTAVRWVAIAIILIALPVLRLARETPLKDRFSNMSLKGISVIDGPAEMGGSIRPLIETVYLIGPTTYRHGKTYWIGIKGIVPNAALHWRSPVSQSLDDLPASLWITAVADPWSYKNYGGLGFSAIAEPYMNFGIVGVITYFFLLALLLVRLEHISIQSSFGLATWALVLGPLFWTTRNDSANFFRPASWGLLCLASIHVLRGGYRAISRGTPEKPVRLKAVQPVR